ncbi:PREDICTED: uncharacterized protein LOC109215817 [Nicotiana attenuata]|uniref:uncharacterized protein LOC109215817 n=1 Tax=Nicotiana attenuata TaxID=49451 RepID=UPI00090571F5|nr:PREDICTED: uncharacterized protein LOC109215817 [Nicotiana attenuata]
MAGNEERPVIEAARPNLALMTQAVVKPDIMGYFKLKQYMVQLIQSTGQLTLFPFSLMGEAMEWLKKEPANSIHNWDDLARKFLMKFFPTKKTKSLRSQILGFQQRDGETLRQAWERFKKLLRDCPHHCQTDEVLGHTFVDGLDEASKMNLDLPCGGDGELRRALKQKAAGVIELDDFSAMRAEIARLANQMNKVAMHHAQQMQHVQQMSACYELCGEGHTRDICTVNPESIYYVGQQARGSMNQHAQYGNTYNLNWRNHPNFSWAGNQNIRPQAKYNHPPQPSQQAEESLTDLMKKLLIDNQQLCIEFRNLERQFGQMANNQNTRPAGALPSDTKHNPKAQVNAVTLRNGRELEEVPEKNKYTARSEGELVPKPFEENKKEKPEIVTRPPPLFLQRLQKQNDDAMYKKFLDILSQVRVNLPLVETSQEVPEYARYLRHIVANKQRHTECETVALTEECSARVQSKLPPKFKDPGCLTIPVSWKTRNEEVPIILGRPLLATGGALIDVREGKLKMRVELKGIEQSPYVNCSDSDRTTELEEVVLQAECVRMIEKRARDERGDLLRACKKARLNGRKKKRKRTA